MATAVSFPSGFIVGLVVSQLAVSIGVAIPVILALVLAADAGALLLGVSVMVAAIAGAAMCWWIGRAFGGRQDVSRAFAIGPLTFSFLMAALVIARWDGGDLVGRALVVPYISGNLALAVAFLLARRRMSVGTRTDSSPA